MEYRALIANLRGVERAIACGCKKVKLNVSASRAITWLISTGRRKKVLLALVTALPAPRKRVLRFRGSISMAFGSPWDKEIPIGAVASIVEAYMAVGINEIPFLMHQVWLFRPKFRKSVPT